MDLIESIFKFVPSGLIFVSNKSQIVKINQRACELLGVEASDAMGKKSIEIYSDSKLQEVIDQERYDEHIEMLINDHACIGTRVPIYHNEHVIGALAIFEDKTQFNHINALREKQKTENDLLHTILELAYDGILVVDTEGTITMISEAYKKFLGLPDESVIGKNVVDVIENTRMHIVAKTGVAEVNDIQRINSGYMVATRIPFYSNGKLAGAIGKVLFRDVTEIDAIRKKFDSIENDLNSLKSELMQTHTTKYDLKDVITLNEGMIKLKSHVNRLSTSDSNITITGESGTGKELFAHSIHSNSSRRYKPFVKVNCAAIPDNLLESELFGYEKGAFTGANLAKMGKFEIADGGTLFLDEIGDMPLQMQAKILRTLQEGEVERIGSNKTRRVDVRIIAATNRNLDEMIREKSFREDLYYRINVINFKIPPLKKRKEDIVIISNHILDEFNHKYHKNVKGLSQKAKNILLSHEWPGNVRELRNVIERAYHIMDGEIHIQPYHLPAYLTKSHVMEDQLPLKKMMEENERKIIIDRLLAFNGNRTQTAKDLGISRMALHNKIEKYNL